jgi:hypothetical protein
MGVHIRIVLVSGVFFVLIVGGVYGIMLLRKWLYIDEEEEEEGTFLTTAELEEARRGGLVTEDEYERLRKEVFEASKRRSKAK